MYPDGKCSGYLDSLEIGDAMPVFRAGSNIREISKQNGAHCEPPVSVGLIAFGVGITECLPVARTELEWGDRHYDFDKYDTDRKAKEGKVTLLW